AGGEKLLIVGAGGFASLQAAIDAADANDTIMIAEGAFAGDATIGAHLTGLTIFGTQAGSDGTLRDPAAGTGESTVDGRISILAANVTIDGIRVLNGNGSGIYVQAQEATIRNSVFHSSTGN